MRSRHRRLRFESLESRDLLSTVQIADAIVGESASRVTVPVEIDDALLEYVAQVSGGRYFRARDGMALQRIYEQIDQLERSPIQAKRYVRYQELYRWPLAVAIAALLLEMMLLAWKGPVP